MGWKIDSPFYSVSFVSMDTLNPLLVLFFDLHIHIPFK